MPEPPLLIGSDLDRFKTTPFDFATDLKCHSQEVELTVALNASKAKKFKSDFKSRGAAIITGQRRRRVREETESLRVKRLREY